MSYTFPRFALSVALIFKLAPAANRYAFKQLSSTTYTAGDSVIITVQVLDPANQVVVTEERDVTVTASGSALEAPTLLNIQRVRFVHTRCSSVPPFLFDE